VNLKKLNRLPLLFWTLHLIKSMRGTPWVRVARLPFLLLLLQVFRTVATGVKRPCMRTHVCASHTDRFQFMDENKNTTNL
jgi:hypothetical protein